MSGPQSTQGAGAVAGASSAGVSNLDLDFDRARRCGCPEVVFGQGKSVAEILTAAVALYRAHGRVLVTRAEDAALAALAESLPGEADQRGRCFLAGAPLPDAGPVALVSAGTADEAVVREAAATLGLRGISIQRHSDCGVAGLHRLLRQIDAIRSCICVVAVAGMEGALPGVLTGLVDIPVIGVPTSIGYGVAAGGQTALHGMLSSCASGLMVVNIDNGFGAAYAAANIVRATLRRVVDPTDEQASTTSA